MKLASALSRPAPTAPVYVSVFTALLLGGCAADFTPQKSDATRLGDVEEELTSALYRRNNWTNITQIVGLIQSGQTVHGNFIEDRVAGYLFTGRAGQSISLELSSGNGDAIVLLYGPQTAQGNWPPRLAKDDDGGFGTDALLADVELPADGTYLALAAEFDRATGSYSLRLDHGGGGCVPVTCEEIDAECGTIDDGCGGEEYCGGCPGGYVCSDDGDNICIEDEPELETIDVTGYVVGDYVYGDSEARASWESACQNWLSKMSQLSSGTLDTYSCSAPFDVSGGFSFKQYASRPTIRFAFWQPSGASTPLEFTPFEAIGVVSDDMSEQYKSWLDDCYESLARVQATLGYRFLAGSCAEPGEIHGGSSFKQYAGNLKVWAWPAQPSTAETIQIRGYAAGDYLYGRENALTSWRDRCEAWVANTKAGLGSAVVESFSCGSYGDISGGFNFKQFASRPTMTLRSQLDTEGSITSQVPVQATGAHTDDVNEQWRTWREDCAAEIASLRQTYGSRFIAGSCDEPTDISGGINFKQLSGDVRIWLAPLGP